MKKMQHQMQASNDSYNPQNQSSQQSLQSSHNNNYAAVQKMNNNYMSLDNSIQK